ncbi:MAG: alanine racemase [Myxococcota bacterium]
MVDNDRQSELEGALAERIEDLLTPALVIDLDAFDHNAAAIVQRVGDPSRWRPHVKTIKQARLIKALMRKGVTQLKCATLDELALALDTAERVHPEGEVDAMLAYPVSKTVLRGVIALLGFYEGAEVRLVADSPEHLAQLDGWLGELGGSSRLSVMLEVDTGMHRTGSSAEVWHAALDQIGGLANIALSGLHGYEGHVAWTDQETAFAGYDALVGLANALPAKSVAHIVTSGSHGFVHALEHAGLGDGPWRHEVSPGTLVLSDLRSHAPAEALQLHQAAFVASRVVSHPGEGRVTLDAGSKAIAPDRPAPSSKVLGWANLEPLTPSEEHLPVRVKKGARPDRGAVVFLVPDHVCTTVNLYRKVIYVRGGEWIGIGEIEAMSRTLRLKDNRP